MTNDVGRDTDLDGVRDFLARYRAAWADPASGRLAEIWDADGEMLHPELDEPVRGRAAIMDYLAMVLSAAPDLRVEPLGAAADGPTLFVHWRTRATIGGRPMAWEGVDRFELRNGRAIRGVGFFDTHPLRESALAEPLGEALRS